ncbi:NlpC/P60 family protein [Streptomyces luteolifulvus]|uniref:NlpC/P60 family protein n=1 Tax=Streptomyces luteolifulvus TaxID=2615112 RepID=A0A6H9UV33_9ACTN|nr:peptidoglycan-binding protein [Streptomyces luteolifulvus]KAB1142691.1 NlpC/P60 family protein [Streptomyces luteolifulvus]
MKTPVFEEFDPASDCDCPGCAHWGRVPPHPRAGRTGGRPAAHRAVILAAAASAALGAGHAAPAVAAPHAPDRPGVPAGDEPETPQGGKAPLHGPGGTAAQPAGPLVTPATTRADIIIRAKLWVAEKVPYSLSDYRPDGYRQDCSGFVSMAWNLPGNEWTGTLDQYGVRITKDELQPGDILLFHNPADPERGSHVVIFGGWTDYTHTYYLAYEETRPSARSQATPYPYWSHAESYVAYRYKGLTSGTADAAAAAAGTGGAPDTGSATAPDLGTAAAPDPATTPAPAPAPAPAPDTAAAAPAQEATPYPGAVYFGPGADNKYVTQLGQLLVARGAGTYYTSGPGPRWTDADRRATRAFQLAQGWTGVHADGLLGPQTWALLTTGGGKGVTAPAAAPPAPPAPPPAVPGYPGPAVFRPGAANEYITQLGKQLVKKGFGKHYTTGPGPRWTEADRRGVEDFQRAQGWRGGAADGYPGPETWRRLFS